MRLRQARLVRSVTVLSSLVSLCIGDPARAGATFTRLGFLPGGDLSVAADVSADGAVVVGWSDSYWPAYDNQSPQAFRWTSSTGMVGLGELPGAPPGARRGMSTASAVSDDGAVIVGDSNTSPFRWTSATGMTDLGDLPGGDTSGDARGVSADGSIVAGVSYSSSGFEVFRWSSATGMVGLGDIPGGSFGSYAQGISGDGSVIVGVATVESPPGGRYSSHQQAMRWSSDTGMEALGHLFPPPDDRDSFNFSSGALAASADGSVIVGLSRSTTGFAAAFRWSRETGMVPLEDAPLGTVFGAAYDVSADGSVVVGSREEVGTSRRGAFRWSTREGMLYVRDMLLAGGVDLTGWGLLASAVAVSSSGNVIAGFGTNPAGNEEAWLADLGSNPIADAGDNQVLMVPGLVSLDGGHSLDPDGDAISYEWSLTPPPGSSAVLDDATAESPGFIADVYGDYVATLIVTDVVGLKSEIDTVTVGFANLAPVADAGTDQAVYAGDTVVLDGSASADANGDSLTFSWTLDSRPAGSGAVLVGGTTVAPRFVADEAGDYSISLVVDDGLRGSAPDTVLVTATSLRDAAIAGAMEIIAAINALTPGDFNNRNNQRTLVNKVTVVLRMIDSGNHTGALTKLTDDILPKTDGCAASGAPDSDDWITDCSAQASVYPLVVDLVNLLTRLLAP